ncbi:MAG TPA: hypothetical protein ACHBX0_02090 [Arsenophonus sp.]
MQNLNLHSMSQHWEVYTNRIIMRGTEHGIRVRNVGYIGAQAGNIFLSVDGKITNIGVITSNQHLAIESQQAAITTAYYWLVRVLT